MWTKSTAAINCYPNACTLETIDLSHPGPLTPYTNNPPVHDLTMGSNSWTLTFLSTFFND